MSAATVTVGIPTYNRVGLLQGAIDSVLAQEYEHFRILISDNASTDATSALVASYRDPRIDYVQSDHNVGVIGNFNRLIELADTDFLMLLSDDDRLYPDYLRSVVEVLEQHSSVGLVHTAFDELDIDSRVQQRDIRVVKTRVPLTIESGPRFLERSMTSLPTCFSTVTGRTHAIREAGAMRAGEELFGDMRLVMRVALKWDVAFIARPLVGFRVHDDTQTRSVFGADAEQDEATNRALTYGQALHDRRIGFLADAELPKQTRDRYRALASLRLLADRAGLGAPCLQTWAGFAQIVRLHPRILAHPIAWRLVAAQSGGRSLRRVASGASPLALRPRSSPEVESPSR